jgi:hypothetical protein
MQLRPPRPTPRALRAPALAVLALLAAVTLGPTLSATTLPEVPLVTSGPYGAWMVDEVDVGYGMIAPDTFPDYPHTAIAVDARNQAHLLGRYWHPGPPELVLTSYHYRVGALWVREDVLPGAFHDIAIGADDLPRIVVHNGQLDQLAPLLYGTRAPTGDWTFETITTAYVYHVTLVMDAQGNPHVTWQDRPNGIVYASRAPDGTWTSEVVDGQAIPSTLAIAPDGTPHVAYAFFSGPRAGQAIIATRDASSGAWSHETVHQCGDTVHVGFALDAVGDAHLACYGNSGFTYVKRTNGAWGAGETIAPGRGETVDLAVDAAGTPHVAYEGPSIGTSIQSALWYAVRTPAGAWERERVDSLGPNVGARSGLALDSLGTPRIAYEVWNGPFSYAMGGVQPGDFTMRYAEHIVGAALGTVVGLHPALVGTLP